MARQDLYILKRGETAIGLEGFVIVLDQYVLLLSLEYAEPSCHYLIGSTLVIYGFEKNHLYLTCVKYGNAGMICNIGLAQYLV